MVGSETSLPQTDPPSISDDYVVEEAETNDRRGCGDLSSPFDVVGAGRWITGGVVVRQGERHAVVPKDRVQHLPHGQQRVIDCTAGDGHRPNRSMAGVENHQEERLPAILLEEGLHQVDEGLRRADRVPVFVRTGSEAPNEFKRGHERRRPSRAHTVGLCKFLGGGPGDARESSVLGKEMPREVDGTLAPHPTAEQDREQFPVWQMIHVAPPEPLSGAVFGRKVSDRGAHENTLTAASDMVVPVRLRGVGFGR
jgi:hypothetical protein